ncbi:aminotransferase class III-fold pyridoxal phosphate-dependent enzyme, partial [bacterium]|nr:aminotransferase class III-fold pyridoxal phosphate-dependent enzyme [bacterium]
MQTEKVIRRDLKYIMHTYNRSPLVLERGMGMTAYDAEGNAYLDFTSGIGVNSLGYCHPAWVAAVAEQAGRLQHTSNLYYTAPDAKLAKRLCRRTGMDQVFFGNSGAEANEGAIKCARKYSVTTFGPDRNKVLTLVNSFHGRTLATLTATGQDVFHRDFGPFPGNFAYVAANDFDALKAAADDTVCAVMMEMVQGEGGVVALDPDYVHQVESFCRERDILIVVDEVQTGVGRTGTLFAFQQYGIIPDGVSFAKGIAGGLPMGGFLVNERCRNVLGPGTHATTFGGNPICAAAAQVVLDT